MNSGIDKSISKAYFISPIVNIEQLIKDMMSWANVTEDELEAKKIIPVEFGDDLSWDYLQYVRNNPVNWNVSTNILYGSKDNLQSIDTISKFAKGINGKVTVMEGGKHWFNTKEQMKFLDNWIKSNMD